MAAIVDIEKIAEADETATYRYGIERWFDHSITIREPDRQPLVVEENSR